jgi:hypothetical protein
MKLLLKAPAITAVVALSTLLAPVGASNAATGTVGSPDWITINNGVTYDGCVDIPFDLKPMSAWAAQQAGAWGNLNDYYNYKVNLSLIGPDGTEVASDTIVRSADNISEPIGSDADTFFSCANPGTYVVQATGFWCPIYYTAGNPDCENIAFTRSFNMRPTSSRIALKAKKTASVRHKLKVTAKVVVERTTGYYNAEGVKVKLQYKRGHRWVNYDSGYTSTSGNARFAVRFGDRGAFKLRALVVRDFYAASKSKVVKVRVGV